LNPAQLFAEMPPMGVHPAATALAALLLLASTQRTDATGWITRANYNAAVDQNHSTGTTSSLELCQAECRAMSKSCSIVAWSRADRRCFTRYGSNWSAGAPDQRFISACLAGMPGCNVSSRTATAAAPAPAVYWLSSPTLENETLMVAGAGLAGATVELCSDPACTEQIDTDGSAVTWEQSVQLVLPAISAPTYIKLTTGAASDSARPATSAAAAAATILPINAPEIWWAISGEVGTMRNGSIQTDGQHPSWVNTSVTAGESVRIFGRSLAWETNGQQLQCISGAQRPAAVGTTTLAVASGTPVSASSASCYEATFSTQNFAPGVHQATVATPWGETSFGLTVYPAPPQPPPPPTRIDVTKDFGGDLHKALAHAATLPASTAKLVALPGAAAAGRAGDQLQQDGAVICIPKKRPSFY
jgi:hypothetical protein